MIFIFSKDRQFYAFISVTNSASIYILNELLKYSIFENSIFIYIYTNTCIQQLRLKGKKD